MPCVVNVLMTIDTEDPDEAYAFVRAELAKKLGDGEEGQRWQTKALLPLPRWQMGNVLRMTKMDERGFPVA